MIWVERGDIDVILVVDTDRLYRKLVELVPLTAVLMKAEVPVFSVRTGDVDLTTADGRLHANIKGAVAQHESEKKSERVADAALRRARKGRFCGGGRRFGYVHRDTKTVYLRRGEETREMLRPTGPLLLVPVEAEAIRWAYKHVARGGSLGSVAREWNGRGLVGSTGARFSDQTVRDVLVRPMNCGLVVINGVEIGMAAEMGRKGDVPPAMVSLKVWRTVQAILGDPSRKTYRGRPATSMLAPALRCTVCLGAEVGTGRMSAKSKVSRTTGVRHLLYACRKGGHVSRRRGDLDLAITAQVLDYLMEHKGAIRRPAPQAASLARAAHKAEELRGQLAGLHAVSGSFKNPVDYLTATNNLRLELEQVEKQLVSATGRPATSALLREKDIPAAWAAMDTDAKRTVIVENVKCIEVGRGKRGAGPEAAAHNVQVRWL
jgi:hypothetical protein